MVISIDTKQSYSEVDEFLELLTEEQRNKIPKHLREMFKSKKDKEYIKRIDPNIPIKEQNLKEETLGIIAYLNLQYWCEDENEKERLKEVYAKNEKDYQEMFQVGYNPDELFKNKLDDNEEIVENTQITEYKESFVKKFINKLLNFFKKK